MKPEVPLALTLLTLPGLAAAQEPPTFAQLDTEGTGLITRSQVQAHEGISADFDAIDSNGDGRVDEAEYARWRAIHDSATD